MAIMVDVIEVVEEKPSQFETPHRVTNTQRWIGVELCGLLAHRIHVHAR